MRHALKFALAIAAAALALAGCGGGGGSTPTEGHAATTSTSTRGHAVTLTSTASSQAKEKTRTQAQTTPTPSRPRALTRAEAKVRSLLHSASHHALPTGEGASPRLSSSAVLAELHRHFLAAARKIRHFGHPASAADRAAATVTLLGYLNARAGGQWSRACSFLSSAFKRELSRLLRKLPGGGCFTLVAANSKSSPNGSSIKVTGVRVAGGDGYISYRAAGVVDYIRIARQGSRWLLAEPNGATLP